MTTPEEMQIRNVIATPVGKTNFGRVCQPAEHGTPDRIWGVCKKYRLEPLIWNDQSRMAFCSTGSFPLFLSWSG